MSGPTTFAKAAARAFELPTPRTISRLILASTDGAHNGLRAACYDHHVTGTGAERTTHPERIAESRNTDLAHDGDTKPPKPRQRDYRRPLDDLRELSKASERFVVSVASLIVEAASGDPGDMDEYTWDDAVKDAQYLLEVRHDHHPDEDHDRTKCGCIDSIDAAELAGRDIHRYIDGADRSTKTIRAIHCRYLPAPATRWVQIREDGLQADEICDTCASLDPPVYIAARHKEHLACRHCNDLRLEYGERPPRWVKQAFHHGTQLEYRKALTAWHAELRMGVCG